MAETAKSPLRMGEPFGVPHIHPRRHDHVPRFKGPIADMTPSEFAIAERLRAMRDSGPARWLHIALTLGVEAPGAGIA